jgi:sporulation protein YlmC with PRC-barrel domain
MRAGELINRTVYDRNGERLGRAADLLAYPDSLGRLRITHVLVTPRWRGRLFGYERPGMQGPVVIEWLARALHRGTREVPWNEVRWHRSAEASARRAG